MRTLESKKTMQQMLSYGGLPVADLKTAVENK
jgi:hypothetical protein